MDILHLVDRLEDMINNSRAIPLTRNVIIDEDRFIEIIDQMRISIPDEIKKAQQLLSQRDRVLAQAQEEANRTIQLAKQKAEEYAGRDAIVEAAQTRAEQIIAQSRIEAENIRADADDYVLEALGSIEAELNRLLNQTRNGIAALGLEHESHIQNRVMEMESYSINDPADENLQSDL
jgi:cell division septum initiation protein DivIVA